MKDPDLTTVLVALAVAVSLGLARDLTHERSGRFAEPDQPKWIEASTSQFQHPSGAGLSVKDTQGTPLPPSTDTNPEQ